MTAPLPRRAADFAFRSFDKIRYADTDRQGHVNNAVFATYFETGRVELLFDPAAPLAVAGAEWVIARLELDYRGEIHWPGEVHVGTGIARVGTSSITLVQTAEQDGRIVATATTVIVQIDIASRKAQPVSAAARARLELLAV